MRILVAQLNVTVGDLHGNTQKICDTLATAALQRADLVVFPELSITGYPPEDLLFDDHFLDTVGSCLETIRKATRGLIAIVGLPRRAPKGSPKPLYNSAAILADGLLVGFHDKVHLPTYDLFDEARYFAPGPSPRVWEVGSHRLAITICEDLWEHHEGPDAPKGHHLTDALINGKPTLTVNLSASPFSRGKPSLRRAIFQKAAKALRTPLVVCNQVGGQDSLVFDGNSLFIDAQGHLVATAAPFREDLLIVDASATPPPTPPQSDIQDLHDALVLGIRDFFHKQNFTKAIVGLSGGLDSALVCALAATALGSDNIIAYALPSRYSSQESFDDANTLAQRLGIALHTLSIEPSFCAHLDTLAPLFGTLPHNVAEENLQARIRGTLLSTIANKFGYLLLSTGNKSELAMGYCTLYGDMCGALAPLADVTKTRLYALAKHLAMPQNLLTKAPTAELAPNQKDSDTLPPYPLLDSILEEHLEGSPPTHDHPPDLVAAILARLHAQEFKRRQAPPGLRVTDKAFCIGRHLPIVQKWCRQR